MIRILKMCHQVKGFVMFIHWILILCVQMLYPYVCIFTACVQSPRRALDSLEQELQMTVSICLGTGNRSWSFTRAIRSLNCWSISSAPRPYFIECRGLSTGLLCANAALDQLSCVLTFYYSFSCFSFIFETVTFIIYTIIDIIIISRLLLLFSPQALPHTHPCSLSNSLPILINCCYIQTQRHTHIYL